MTAKNYKIIGQLIRNLISQGTLIRLLSTAKKNIKDGVKESRSFSLALIIIAGYIVFFGVVMYQNPTNYEGWQTLNATYGVVVATVV